MESSTAAVNDEVHGRLQPNGPQSSTYGHLSDPSPEWQEFYRDNYNAIPVLEGSAQDMRKMLADMKANARSAGVIEEGLDVKDLPIEMRDGVEIKCRVYTPTTGSSPFPAILYLHGGGWSLGDLEGEDATCRFISSEGNTVVVSLDYRLFVNCYLGRSPAMLLTAGRAPENPYPAGFNDSWDGLIWTIDHINDLHIDRDRLLVAGSSSGANLAAAVALKARDNSIPLRGQILRIPATCHMNCYPPELNLTSMEQNKDAPILSKKTMELFWGFYSPPNPSHYTVSPLLAASFHGLAPAYLQIAGLDPLRDEGLAYADKLKEANVPLRINVYPGVPHAFGVFPSLKAAQKNSADLIGAIKWLTEK